MDTGWIEQWLKTEALLRERSTPELDAALVRLREAQKLREGVLDRLQEMDENQPIPAGEVRLAMVVLTNYTDRLNETTFLVIQAMLRRKA